MKEARPFVLFYPLPSAVDQADFIALGSDLQHRRRITGTLHQQLGDAVLHLPADGPPVARPPLRSPKDFLAIRRAASSS